MRLCLCPQAEGADLLMYRLDIYFKTDPELAVIAQQFAADEALFLSELGQAWTLLMNADMFDGPQGNLCANPEPTTTTTTTTKSTTTTTTTTTTSTTTATTTTTTSTTTNNSNLVQLSAVSLLLSLFVSQLF